MSYRELMRSVVIDEVDEEYGTLQEQCYNALCLLIERGIFSCELREKEWKQLRMAHTVIDELMAVREHLLSGKYPRPGEPLSSLELYALYRCYYRYEHGIEYINYFNSIDFSEVPIVRLYLNGWLVGLFVSGRCVMNFYRAYLGWLVDEGWFLPIMETLL